MFFLNTVLLLLFSEIFLIFINKFPHMKSSHKVSNLLGSKDDLLVKLQMINKMIRKHLVL